MTAAKRMTALRQRRKKEGLVNFRRYVKEETVEKLDEYIRTLENDPQEKNEN